MRKIVLIAVFSLIAVWSRTQTTPATPASDSPPPAQSEGQHHRMGGMGVAGTITTVSSDSLTVKTMDGNTVKVNLSDKTQFRKDRQPATLADFKVGDQIMVRGQQSGDAWQADMVAARPAGGFGGGQGGDQAMRDALGKRFIIGEIKSINGTQLTIERPDSVTQTITVDESTSFQKQGESITLADFKVGDHVFGRGELKNNVFVPATLNIGEPRMMGRGRGAGQGQGAGDGQPQGQGQGQSQPSPDSH